MDFEGCQQNIDPIAERWARYPVLKQVTEKEETYTLRSEPGLEVADELKDKYLTAIREDYHLSIRILGEHELDNFKDYFLILVNRMAGIMDNGLRINFSRTRDLSSRTIAASIVHEFVEGWREDHDLWGEGAPLLAEYIMGGEDSRIETFIDLMYLDEDEAKKYIRVIRHTDGWKKIVSSLGMDRGNVEATKTYLKGWKNSMSEEQKVNFIKQQVLNWNG